MRLFLTAFAFTGLLISKAVALTPAISWQAHEWVPPYDFNAQPNEIVYKSYKRTSDRKWKLCVIFPHLKDPFWVAANFGVVQQAERLGVALDLYESGGYPNLERQIQQVRDCAKNNYDAILLGAVSYDLLTTAVVEVAQTVPVFGTVNQISGEGITGLSTVNWIDMGSAAGNYLAKKHPAGTRPAKVAWIPGPDIAAWVQYSDRGFRDAIEGAAVDIVTVKNGDTGKEIQKKLVEDALEEHPNIDYIAGNAIAIEAAMAIVRQRGLEDQIKLMATYFTPAMYRGVRRGKVVVAPTDSTALQGVLSVDQAVRYLDGQPIKKHIGPRVFNVTKENVNSIVVDESIAPATFSPTFSVE